MRIAGIGEGDKGRTGKAGKGNKKREKGNNGNNRRRINTGMNGNNNKFFCLLVSLSHLFLSSFRRVFYRDVHVFLFFFTWGSCHAEHAILWMAFPPSLKKMPWGPCPCLGGLSSPCGGPMYSAFCRVQLFLE